MFKRKETKLQHAFHIAGHHIKDLFIPHEGNDHRPHVLHHRALMSYSILLVAFKVAAVILTVSLPASSVYSSAITAGNIISLTNATRSSLGLETLISNGLLANAAQSKANDMALNEYFAHTSPTGTTPWYWIRSAGYSYTYAGENLAVHFSEAEDVTAGWMASPTHRANIVEPRFKEIGVGVSYGRFQDYPTTFVVQMFGVNESAVPEIVEEIIPEPVEPIEEIAEDPVIEVVEEVVEDTTEPVEDVEIAVEVQGDDTIGSENVVVTPAKNEYKVEVDVPGAETVSLQLAGETARLDNVEGDTWTGSIVYEESLIDDNGENILLVAVGEDGEQLIEPITYIAPASDVDDLYAFEGEDRKDFFGLLTVKNVNDSVQFILLFTALFLGAAVMVTMILRVEKKHHTMLVHVLAVFILVFVLAIV